MDRSGRLSRTMPVLAGMTDSSSFPYFTIVVAILPVVCSVDFTNMKKYENSFRQIDNLAL